MAEKQPKYKTWKFTKLEDLLNVDEWFVEKVLYFLGYAIRKCRLQKRTLISMTFFEQGQRIQLVTRDNETGEMFTEPKDENPLD